MQKPSLQSLRQQAIASSFFPPTGLQEAIERLGFVQADPIRAPARAQDLILRHRVKGYQAGDLEHYYPSLPLEEDFLYAYGFMPQATWQLLHPRGDIQLSPTHQRVLELVRMHQRIHPRQLEAYLGHTRERNDWGGYSTATTRVLQSLHYRGLLRVAGREKGVRLYQPTPRRDDPIPAAERLQQLVLLLASMLGPLSEASLRAVLKHLAYGAPSLEGKRSILSTLVDSGELTHAIVDGVRYVWTSQDALENRPNEAVRFLAPFDPLVWDRRRFEHFWGWPYRFEAYTPAAKRQMGYYALPMLWQEEVIGWVTASYQAGNLVVEPGFRKEVPTDVAFFNEFDAEVERLRFFLQTRSIEF